MQHITSDDSAILAALYQAVRIRGLAPVARELGVVRATLGAVLLGNARPGSRALVLEGWRRHERQEQAR